MEKLSTVDIIKSFSKIDHKGFRYFLTVHKLRHVNAMHRIYKTISRVLKKNYSEEFLQTQINYAASPEGNAKTAKHNISMLHKVLNDFLSLKRYEEDTFLHGTFTARELLHRGLSEQLKDHLNKMEKELKSKDDIDISYANESYWININKYNYFRRFVPIDKVKTMEEEQNVLETLSVSFLTYFLLEIMSYYNNLIIQSENVKYDYEKNKLFKIINLLEIEKFIKLLEGSEYHLIVSLYFQATKLVTSKTKEEYYKYKKLVLANADKFSLDERSYHFTNLLNYCTYQINLSSAKNDFYDELSEIQQTILYNKYYITKANNKLTHEMFWSVVTGLIKNGKKDEALKVINEFRYEMPEFIGDCMYNMGLAYLANIEHRSKDSINYLIRVELEYLPYRLDFNIIMIKNFYELQYKVEAIQTLEIHEKSLVKNCGGSEILMEKHKNFVKYIRHLLFKYQKLDELKTGLADVKKLKNIAAKDWLIVQYEEQIETVRKKGYVSPAKIGLAE